MMSESDKLFIGNLSANLDEADLHAFFEHFSEIVDLKIHINQFLQMRKVIFLFVL